MGSIQKSDTFHFQCFFELFVLHVQFRTAEAVFVVYFSRLGHGLLDSILAFTVAIVRDG
jgi:hypothetical protein